jgi:hypothetical protein
VLILYREKRQQPHIKRSRSLLRNIMRRFPLSRTRSSSSMAATSFQHSAVCQKTLQFQPIGRKVSDSKQHKCFPSHSTHISRALTTLRSRPCRSSLSSIRSMRSRNCHRVRIPCFGCSCQKQYSEAYVDSGNPRQDFLENAAKSKLTERETQAVINHARDVARARGIDKIFKDFDINIVIGPAESALTQFAAAAGK